MHFLAGHAINSVKSRLHKQRIGFITPHPIQAAEDKQRGCCQILDALDSKNSMAAKASAMPAGFLERFAEQFEDESLPEIISEISECNNCVPESAIAISF